MREASPLRAAGKRAGSGSRPAQSIEPLRCCAASRREMKLMSAHFTAHERLIITQPFFHAATRPHVQPASEALRLGPAARTAPAQGGAHAGAGLFLGPALP